MKHEHLILAAAIFAATWHAAWAGDLTGKVILAGTPPGEIPIDFSANPKLQDLHPTVTTTRHYVTGKDSGLKDVLVYISKGFEGKTFPVPAEPVELDAVKASFEPYVMGVMVGQKFVMKNEDPAALNFHVIPRVPGNAEANVFLPEQGQSTSTTFAKPEVMVKVSSDVNIWMFAYVGVMDNPYFAVTDADGHFKIPNVPPGDYTLTAFHPYSHRSSPTHPQGISREIHVTGANPVVENFIVDIPMTPF